MEFSHYKIPNHKFFLGEYQSILLLADRNWFSSCNCRELHPRQQETSRRFCDTKYRLIGHMFFSSNATKWVKARLLPSKPSLFASNISFISSQKKSFTNFKQRPSAEFHGHNVKYSWFNIIGIISCRDADNRELKNHDDDFVDDDRKWVTVYCESATSKFRRRGVDDDAKQSRITSSCNPQASAGTNPLF